MSNTVEVLLQDLASEFHYFRNCEYRAQQATQARIMLIVKDLVDYYDSEIYNGPEDTPAR